MPRSSIRRRAGLFVFLVVLSAFPRLLLASDDAPKRPNILLIYADDQSYKTISCYGANPSWVETPNIDALARRGVRFHRAYLGAWCMPSRASILTGRLQHGIQTMRMVGKYPGSEYDPEKCPFIPAQMRAQGYQTAQIGKWHTGTDAGYGRDWDHQIVWNRPANPDNAGNYFYDQILSENGRQRRDPGYSTDNYTEWAVDYINDAGQIAEKPWFLWLCYGAVHGPTTPAERHKGLLDGKTTPPPNDILGPWPTKPSYLDNSAAWIRTTDGTLAMKKKNVPKSNFNVNDAGKSFNDWIEQMNECNMAIDEGVGRVMQALKASGQLDNTIVIYTADQGYGLGEHGFNQKVAPYDATIASPLIISQPGVIPTGKFCEQPVNAPDLMRYVCARARVNIPWRIDGRDITGLVHTPELVNWKQPMLFTHTGRKYGEDTETVPTDKSLTEVGNVPWYAMLRSGKYKYVRTLVEGEPEELYDLEADPEELNNLAFESEHHATVKQFRDETQKQLTASKAGFADAMPTVRPLAP